MSSFIDVNKMLPKWVNNNTYIQVIVKVGHKNHVPDTICAIYYDGKFYDIELWNDGENKVIINNVLCWKYVS